MARTVCRSCGTAVAADALTCPECGTADPVAPAARQSTHTQVHGGGPAATPGGAPEERSSAGSRLKSAAKAIGCLVIAIIVLLIALMAGLLDFIF